jgi:hypothetical protein
MKKFDRNPPDFSLRSTKVRLGGNSEDKATNRTQAYEVQCDRSNAKKVVSLLRETGKIKPYFITYRERQRNPELFLRAIRKQNEILATGWILKISGLNHQMMDKIKPSLIQKLGATDVFRTRKTESTGEWKVMVPHRTFGKFYDTLQISWNELIESIPQAIRTNVPTAYGVPKIDSRKPMVYQEEDEISDRSYDTAMRSILSIGTNTTEDDHYEIPSEFDSKRSWTSVVQKSYGTAPPSTNTIPTLISTPPIEHNASNVTNNDETTKQPAENPPDAAFLVQVVKELRQTISDQGEIIRNLQMEMEKMKSTSHNDPTNPSSTASNSTPSTVTTNSTSEEAIMQMRQMMETLLQAMTLNQIPGQTAITQPHTPTIAAPKRQQEDSSYNAKRQDVKATPEPRNLLPELSLTDTGPLEQECEDVITISTESVQVDAVMTETTSVASAQPAAATIAHPTSNYPGTMYPFLVQRKKAPDKPFKSGRGSGRGPR